MPIIFQKQVNLTRSGEEGIDNFYGSWVKKKWISCFCEIVFQDCQNVLIIPDVFLIAWGDVPDYKLFNDTKFTASSCICKNIFRECRARTTNNLALEFVFVTSVVEAHTLERSQPFYRQLFYRQSFDKN